MLYKGLSPSPLARLLHASLLLKALFCFGALHKAPRPPSLQAPNPCSLPTRLSDRSSCRRRSKSSQPRQRRSLLLSAAARCSLVVRGVQRGLELPGGGGKDVRRLARVQGACGAGGQGRAAGAVSMRCRWCGCAQRQQPATRRLGPTRCKAPRQERARACRSLCCDLPPNCILPPRRALSHQLVNQCAGSRHAGSQRAGSRQISRPAEFLQPAGAL